MKNHELLDMIGDVNEDYVQAADGNAVRPRFRWQGWAVAACAALVLAAYPAYQALNRDLPLEQKIPLHSYTLMEGGALTTQDEVKVPSGGVDEAPPEGTVMPGGAYVAGKGAYTESGEDVGGDIDGAYYNPPGQEIPVDEEPYFQYERLLQGLGGENGREPDVYPEWFAGSWTDHGGTLDAPARLAVAIVEGFRTPELEAQIKDWCGGTGEILLIDAKYSYNHLNSLMDPVVDALDGTNLYSGVGVDVIANCLGMDIYSDGTVPDQVLAELARLDPDGDAIRVRVFTGGISAYDDADVKAPAPVPDTVFSGERAEPAIDPDAFPTPIDGSDEPAQISTAPGGPAGSLPARTQDGHDIPGAIGELPEAKYGVTGGAEDLPGYGLLY